MPGRQHSHALGKSVAELLIRRLKGEMRARERLVLPTGIIERGSVGPPADQDECWWLTSEIANSARVKPLAIGQNRALLGNLGFGQAARG